MLRLCSVQVYCSCINQDSWLSSNPSRDFENCLLKHIMTVKVGRL